MIPQDTPAVDNGGPSPLVVGPPQPLHGAAVNQASGVTEGGPLGTPPPMVAEDSRVPAALLSSREGGDGIEFQPVAARERSVTSLCGDKQVWTIDRSCGCNRCEMRR